MKTKAEGAFEMQWIFKCAILISAFSFNGCTTDKVANREIIVSPPQKNIFYIENKTCLNVTHTRIRCY